MKKIAILGSTGSIGVQSLECIRLHLDKFKITALCAHKNYKLLFEQVREFKPQIAALTGYDKAIDIPEDLKFCKFIFGMSAIEEISNNAEYDEIIISLVGMIGLKALISSLNRKKPVLLANKEALVAGGNLVINKTRELRKSDFVNKKFINGNILASPLNAILPIDSEHSAIFQCLCGSNSKIDKIFLTCSGGPFREWTREEMANATLSQALKHPQWSMGNKISIDSASLFNKALELIEASYLFDVSEKDIEVLIHPQSIVHSMISFKDSSILAQLGKASMKVPIMFALSYPDRYETNVDLPKLSSLNFYDLDDNKFPAISLARYCLRAKGAYCIALNAANEIAVEKFIKEQCKFLDIENCVKYVLEKTENIEPNSLDEILYIDMQSRKIADKYFEKIMR